MVDKLQVKAAVEKKSSRSGWLTNFLCENLSVFYRIKVLQSITVVHRNWYYKVSQGFPFAPNKEKKNYEKVL